MLPHLLYSNQCVCACVCAAVLCECLCAILPGHELQIALIETCPPPLMPDEQTLQQQQQQNKQLWGACVVMDGSWWTELRGAHSLYSRRRAAECVLDVIPGAGWSQLQSFVPFLSLRKSPISGIYLLVIQNKQIVVWSCQKKVRNMVSNLKKWTNDDWSWSNHEKNFERRCSSVSFQVVSGQMLS